MYVMYLFRKEKKIYALNILYIIFLNSRILTSEKDKMTEIKNSHIFIYLLVCVAYK